MPETRTVKQKSPTAKNDWNGMLPLSARCFSLTLFQYEDGHFTGEIHNLCYEEDIPFGGLTEAILQMDHMMDVLGCPQAATMTRSYEEKDQKKAAQEAKGLRKERKRRYDYYRNKDFLNATMKRSPQIQIEVLYRQHSTWQGVVTFTLKKGSAKKANFRSVLELIHLIQSGCQQFLPSKKNQTPENGDPTE